MATQSQPDLQQVEFPTHERPRTDIATLPMIGIAVALTLIIFGLASLASAPTIKEDGTVSQSIAGFIKDLLMGNPKILGERVIFQGTIMFVFALSVASIVLKIMALKKERASIDDATIPANLDYTNKESVIESYERVKSRPDLTRSLGLTRIARVLAMWINTEDFARTSQYAREQAELDALASDSSFRRNRLFIWAMPLLGFVGTVFGVAAGISGFAAFLQQANVSPEQIKVQVGAITTGLAVAFFCTLLGLLTAGLAAFPSLMAERKEENVLGEIDEYVEDRLLSRMPSGGGNTMESKRFPLEELTEAIREGLSGLNTQTKFPMEELAQAIDAGFRRLPNPDRYEEVFTRAVTKAADAINTKYEEFQTNYERRVGELGSQLGGKLESVATGFNSGANKLMDEFRKTQEKNLEVFSRNEQKLADKFEELTEQIGSLGKEQLEQYSDAHEKYLDAISDLDKKEISRWEKMVGEFNQLALRLADQFKQAVTSMETATNRYSERVQGSADALAQQLEKVSLLGVEIDKVLRTTTTMEATLRQVGSSDEFRQTLANLRNHLNTSDELLKQLSRPRKVVFSEARDDGM